MVPLAFEAFLVGESDGDEAYRHRYTDTKKKRGSDDVEKVDVTARLFQDAGSLSLCGYAYVHTVNYSLTPVVSL